MKFKKYFPLLLSLLGVILFSSLCYMWVENYNFIDALYMSVLTLTTVGYGEVQPLTPQGKILNIFLMLLGVGTVTYCFTKLTMEIALIDFDKKRREKMKKKIDALEGHTIVCGFGRMGEIICKELHKHHTKFVIIEKRKELIEEIKKNNFFYVEGSAADDEMLFEAGIERAKVLVSAVDNDSDGLYLALAGRSLNPDLFIIVRANDSKIKRRLIRAGADRVVLPFVMTGQKVAESVINPAVEDLFDLKDDSKSEEDKIQLADLYVSNNCRVMDKTIEEAGPLMANLIVIGIKKPDKTMIFNPSSDYRFKNGDYIITLGPLCDYRKAISELKLESKFG